MTSPRLLSLPGFLTVALLLGCASSTDPDGGAAHSGVFAELETVPMIMIDDELGTDVRVFVHFEHQGGPDAETLEVVSASLRLDLEPYADLELAIPADHPPFPGLVDGESLDFELRGALPDSHDDWGLCLDGGQAAEADGQRVSLDLVLRVKPGANSDQNEFEFESQSVSLGCSFTG
jgi:hypothetical protein